jgi:uncharacterized membrane protein YwzB
MKKKLLAISLSLVVCMALVVPVVFAQDIYGQGSELQTIGTTIYGEEPTTDLRAVLGNVINIALGFLGVALLIIIIYGGFLYMTSGGEEAKIKKGKNWNKNGIIGLVIILLAYAITNFVIQQIDTATNG